MSKILILILVAVVAVVGFRLSKIKTAEPESGDQASYQLTVVEPEVYVKKTGDTEFQKISGTAEIGVGFEVKTSAAGQAEITYPNGTTVSIEENSRIKIAALAKDGSQSHIELIGGSVWSRIKKILGADDYYEVETENTVASVRGTIFAMSYSNGVSDLYVLENKVKAKAKDPQTKKILEETVVEIASEEKIAFDNKALAAGIRKFAKEKMKDDDFKKKFVERHLKKLQDKDFDSDDMLRIRERIKILYLELMSSASPTASPTKSFFPSPSPTAEKSATPLPTPTPTLKEIAPTVSPEPVIESVIPRTVDVSSTGRAEFLINGRNLTGIKQILIGDANVSFFVSDSLTIFVTATSSIRPGIYDISIIGSNGKKLTSPQAVEIK
ncbi:MAG: hypothetical protein A2750_01260 [Candidatus Yanofskybacteria bacterium RIFCSPHIGHO2_01_FULL_45_42]|uniref:FecR protein domain-containing protein n=3 Tax=Candidatus Yanofskyibacteriota TaxID=1752733 RepID=A0A1F8H4U7_9BACT|nr:MAG: hypothetical protein A2750_01260 [Candidatus Yanofskybacteria bacterium RIFCSPHIGHO2_01_FULL_45_42]OGN16597.1 MAG: hypothetical protein A3C81_02415 [Candidatus Yanofskybacteria bacterium RIFCSPHIGHO2_02_FULL_46_19]OGN26569.1 MAG: hypothetical protein A3B17_00750 [Candidatus Yanofskybacteria bacterium RIFCSPLOWO2_01_FULL_45_72]OGN32625.1 MAG: hypothetical protein A3J01_01535 [Candidatus Yanofskybacteria bacterium RIFCSPLOWO2_02_FULL_45_18]